MPRWGLTDRPDKNQSAIVSRLRELGYKVWIMKRPVDLWVVEPTGQCAAWVEVKAHIGAPMTPLERAFFAECPERHRILAYTAEDVIEHFREIFKLYSY